MRRWFKRAVSIVAISVAIGVVAFVAHYNADRDLPGDLLEEIKSRGATVPLRQYAVLIDYRMPISAKRLWIVDQAGAEVLLNTHVGHARKSGFWRPTVISNIPDSNLTCCGLFVTGEIYRQDTRVRVVGLESGVNDEALGRGIVFHAGNFPWWPWSAGCFTTPEDDNRRIVEIAREGAVVFVKGL